MICEMERREGHRRGGTSGGVGRRESGSGARAACGLRRVDGGGARLGVVLHAMRVRQDPPATRRYESNPQHATLVGHTKRTTHAAAAAPAGYGQRVLLRRLVSLFSLHAPAHRPSMINPLLVLLYWRRRCQGREKLGSVWTQ